MSRAIATIVVAQLFGTSLWFSANAASQDLVRAWSLTVGDVGTLTIAVQLGFIVGTLALAATALADRYAASRIFAVAAVGGALANALFALAARGMADALVLRFVTGAALAGIYPLGMKLIVSFAPERAGQALGWLVGMLTLGTALPHLIRGLGAAWPWQSVVLASSGLALGAAVLIMRLGDGPYLAKRAPVGLRPGAVFAAFRVPAFRASALGYFGHMWELYAFWTVLPVLLTSLLARLTADGAAGATMVSLAAFGVIGSGALGCIGGGVMSQRWSSARVAAMALVGSAIACAVYPLIATARPWLAVIVLVVWGVAVVADSPQFSALSAKACPPELVGSALAMQNAIGFAITVVAIALATSLFATLGDKVAWLLLPGPLLGLLGLRPLLKRER